MTYRMIAALFAALTLLSGMTLSAQAQNATPVPAVPTTPPTISGPALTVDELRGCL
jgi:hypothetical protein